jgi:hypothetical protein
MKLTSLFSLREKTGAHCAGLDFALQRILIHSAPAPKLVA